MQAHTLAIAIFLAQGCAPAAMRGPLETGVVTSALRSEADADDGDTCTGRGDRCGGGGTESVVLPLGILIAAFATPALLHYLVR